MSHLDLRLARSADAYRIGLMSRDMIECGLPYWSWTPEVIARNIRDRDTNVLVADQGGQVAGFAIMYFDAQEAYLNLLAVSPSYRRTGVGRRLVHWLEVCALAAGISTVYLEVRENNTGAQAFYKRLGYRDVARVPRYYCRREAAVRMARDLWETNPTYPA